MVKSKKRILIVDDEPRLVRLVREVLGAVGYEVLESAEGETALEMVALERPDLVLLDILLPKGMDGYETCRRIREFSEIPIIMLTAKAQEADIVKGFNVGADDYITKPFSAKELIARVKAALRRSAASDEVTTAKIECGDLEIDFARRQLMVKGHKVRLTPTQYRLLHQLATNVNRVMLHQELLTKVWGPEYRDDIDYLRVHIWNLRRKIEEDPSNPRYILTSPGVGYMLSCPEREG